MSHYELLIKVCERLTEIRRLCSCLPRQCSQTMFIVLGGFQGERAGSWSPREIVASKEDAGMWNGGRWRGEEEKQKGWHDKTRREEGEKTVSWPWKRVINHAHAENDHTTCKSITISFPKPHRHLKQIQVFNAYVKSENKHPSKHLQTWSYIFTRKPKKVWLSLSSHMFSR